MFSLAPASSTTHRPKPFIKWVGGKGQLVSEIERMLPERKLTSAATTYVEPFIGGGAVLFHILTRFPSLKKAVINDINPDLTKSYKTIRDRVEELISMLGEIQNAYFSLKTEAERKSYYLRNRDCYNTKKLGAVENTALFIFLNRTCFNGLHRVNSKGLFNVPFGRYTNPKICDAPTLRADSELLQKVEILTGDFEQTLSHASPDNLFYLDPPYKPLSQTSSFNSYAKDGFGDDEQIRLKQFCDKLDAANVFWVLSNSDVRSNDPENLFFDDLYSSYQINRVFASRMVNATSL